MVPESFFRTVTQYERTPDRDPGEDRLTQVLASVCEWVPGFAGQLFAELIVESEKRGSLSKTQHDFLERMKVQERPTEVTTQRILERVGRPDLVLEFDDAGGKVVVEVKGASESPLTDNQLKNYESRLSGNDVVCLLATSSYLVAEDEQPDPFIHLSWQAVGDWAQERWDTGDDAYATWLVEQFVNYLKEERVMHVPLDEGQFDALLVQHETDQAQRLEEFLNGVEARVKGAMQTRGWEANAKGRFNEGTVTEKPWPARIWNWAPHPACNSSKDWQSGEQQNLLEWRIGGSAERPGSSVEIGAGLVFRPKGCQPPVLGQSIEAPLGLHLSTEKFDTYTPWFIATMPLADLLNQAQADEKEYDGQVRFVSNWILERMEAAGRMSGLVSEEEEPWTSQ